MKRNSGDYNFSVKIKQYDDEIEYVVIFDDFPNLIGVGESVEGAIIEAKENLDAYLEYCYENSLFIPEPTHFDFPQNKYSGKVSLRMSKTLHERASLTAEKEEVSLNSFINDALAYYISAIEKRSAFDFLEKYRNMNTDKSFCIIYVDNQEGYKISWDKKWSMDISNVLDYQNDNFIQEGNCKVSLVN